MKTHLQIYYNLIKYAISGERIDGGILFDSKKDAIWEGLNYLKELSDEYGWDTEKFIEEIDKFIAEFSQYNTEDQILTSYLDIEEVEM